MSTRERASTPHFGCWVTNRLREKNLGVVEAGAIAGISKSSMSRIKDLNTAEGLRPKTRRALIRLFGNDVSQFFAGEDADTLSLSQPPHGAVGHHMPH